MSGQLRADVLICSPVCVIVPSLLSPVPMAPPPAWKQSGVPSSAFAHEQQQQTQQLSQLEADMLQMLHCQPLESQPQQQQQPACPESRSLYNKLVSQLSLAACEVQMDQLALRTSSSHSTYSGSSMSSLTSNSRHNSISGHSPVASRPESMGSTGSPLSNDAFQQLLVQMLHEEWASQGQPGQHPGH